MQKKHIMRYLKHDKTTLFLCKLSSGAIPIFEVDTERKVTKCEVRKHGKEVNE